MVNPVPLGGGFSNSNFVVEDAGNKYVVRIGEDNPFLGIMRFNEFAASHAAFEAGLSPEIVHAEPGVAVIRYIEGRTLETIDIRKPGMIEKIVPMLKQVHYEIPNYLDGPSLAFSVFQAMRNYRHILRREGSRHIGKLERLENITNQLEQVVKDEKVVFAHNDLLPANFIDDGTRLWLLDWDYAGFGSPLFDLANLASNNELDQDQGINLLELYYGRAPDKELWNSFNALKCASLLREAMCCMISEIHSTVDVDWVTYTAEDLDRFEQAYTQYKESQVRLPMQH